MYLLQSVDSCLKHSITTFWDLHLKITRLQARTSFLLFCKKTAFIPPFARVRPAVTSARGERIARHAGLQFIAAGLDEAHGILRTLQSRAFKLFLFLAHRLTYEQLDSVAIVRINKCNAEERHTHRRHVRKLWNWGHSPEDIARFYGYVRYDIGPQPTTPSPCFVNLADVPLSRDECTLLSKGLKFVPHIPPPDRRFLEFVHCAERAAASLDADTANRLHAAGSQLLTEAVPRHRQIAKSNDGRILASLQRKLKQHDILVIPSDKERIPVLIGKQRYIDDVTRQLTDAPYETISKDPSRSMLEAAKTKLQALHKEGSIDGDLYKMLRPGTEHRCPDIYMCPKVHKGLDPLKYRPVVAFYDSPTMKVAKYVAALLTQHLPKVHHILDNGRTFVQHLQHKTIEPNQVMVSLDITSMFTSIPHHLAMDALFDFLFELELDTIPVTPGVILELSKLVMEETFFTFNGTFYRQIIGLPMGSPLSAPLSEIVIRSIEASCLNTLQHPIIHYHRYVDDTFLVVDQEHLPQVLQHFNNGHPAIKFTVEKESAGTLPFLDVLVLRQDGILHTAVHRKPSRPLTTLRDDSCHPMEHRNAAMLFLIDRAKEYCCEPSSFAKEIKTVYTILTNSGYSHGRIQKAVNNRAVRQAKIAGNQVTTAENRRKVFPYLGHNMVPFINNMRRLSIQIALKPGRNLANILARPKIKTTSRKEPEGVVYRIKCKNCPRSYVGQTGRKLLTRTKEHAHYIARQLHERSPLVDHVWLEGHQIHPSEAEVVHHVSDPSLRRSLERYCIHALGNTALNKKEEGHLCTFYQNTIRQICCRGLTTGEVAPTHPVDVAAPPHPVMDIPGEATGPTPHPVKEATGPRPVKDVSSVVAQVPAPPLVDVADAPPR